MKTYNLVSHTSQIENINSQLGFSSNQIVINPRPKATPNRRSQPIFFNDCFDKNKLKLLIAWSWQNCGSELTIYLLENLKNLGFRYATQAGISLGIDDLKIPPTKKKIIALTEHNIEQTDIFAKSEFVSGIEKFQYFIDTWQRTSENLKHTVMNHFKQTDILNPVYMMAYSGARGSVAQVRQLVGMRGLMADPQGQIVGFPIKSNFREGITLTEYLISCYGARKGLVDTALKTANSGYLTRRLIDVCQHMIVSELDCVPKRAVFLTDIIEGGKIAVSLQNRLFGRVLAENIYTTIPQFSEKISTYNYLKKASLYKLVLFFTTVPEINRIQAETVQQSWILNFFLLWITQKYVVGAKNQQISRDVAEKIVNVKKRVLVRSPLTCKLTTSICQLCYGWDLSCSHLISIGEAVGILAAQSIGEPGTQLTMRTFHTGGVFSGDIMNEIIAPFAGQITFPTVILGKLIRTLHGKIAFLAKSNGNFVLSAAHISLFTLNKKLQKKQIFNFPVLTVLIVRNYQFVTKDQVLGEFSFSSSYGSERIQESNDLNANSDGQVVLRDALLHLQTYTKKDYPPITTFTVGSIWVYSGTIFYPSISTFDFFCQPGDLVDKNSILSHYETISPYSGRFFENYKLENYFVNLLGFSFSAHSLQYKQKSYYFSLGKELPLNSGYLKTQIFSKHRFCFSSILKTQFNDHYDFYKSQLSTPIFTSSPPEYHTELGGILINDYRYFRIPTKKTKKTKKSKKQFFLFFGEIFLVEKSSDLDDSKWYISNKIFKPAKRRSTKLTKPKAPRKKKTKSRPEKPEKLKPKKPKLQQEKHLFFRGVSSIKKRGRVFKKNTLKKTKKVSKKKKKPEQILQLLLEQVVEKHKRSVFLKKTTLKKNASKKKKNPESLLKVILERAVEREAEQKAERLIKPFFQDTPLVEQLIKHFLRNKRKREQPKRKPGWPKKKKKKPPEKKKSNLPKLSLKKKKSTFLKVKRNQIFFLLLLKKKKMHLRKENSHFL